MTPVQDVDGYIAAQPAEVQEALQALRRTIRKAAPEATEGISYQVPSYRYHGSLVSFGATKSHCAFYVQSPAVMDAHKDDLKGYDTAKGTVRFPAGQPLPEELVTKLVRARMAENEAARKK